ncbi:conserved hypothetical protein [Pyrobaculum islandicum DSM 4184]|uniref:Chorismate dehydratase n=1 Tax=Pyrobaculum islandicum (strain DSM 4184 / JCM 9189 / GEO3) TaxID=384616 RepID=A1RU54_PYRIL|nr:MqnA/MqnD/SBP family protein [Pyrobaculum islandicum]ABL88486.1 conserved hypothetical protein [Pyrobaculum islandicum DSM 4184]
MVRVVRIRYAHSDPLFWRAKLDVVEAGNLEAARLLREGAADIGFVPITMAAELGLPIVPRLAIYSTGPILSARVFKGRGARGLCAVSETTVSARVVNKLLGVSLETVEDPWAALDACSEVLAIGDEALRMIDKGVPTLLDIGELWQERVGTPLFFAVLVAKPGTEGLEEAVAEMENSLAHFYENPTPLVESTARRLGVSRRLVEEYFQRSRYLLNSGYIQHIVKETEVLGLPRPRFLEL